jgi:drug/metabolite transporter (DMT)-like permease
MSNRNKKWLYLVILSLVWGSSYILIKKTLIGLTPLQLGSLRIIFTTIILLFIGFSSLKKIPKNKWKWIFLTGYIGSFFPSFLFAFAQTEIDSGVAAILNSLTPLATLLIGLGFFKFIIDSKQIVGVIIGLIGSFLLIYEGSTINPNQNLLLVAFIIAASICYATSVNILKAHLQEVPAFFLQL